MTLHDALAELEQLGTAQNRKVYKRHGTGDNLFGVSIANLKTLKKKIKVNHDLARQLWATGNYDARMLATMIADPKQADAAFLDAWAADLSNYVVTDAFSGFASKTALAREKMEQWTRSDDEWIGQAGWNLLAHLAMKDTTLPDAYFGQYVDVIERDIHAGKNRIRHAMNSALIAIGMRNDTLEQKALATAREIGTVAVDHGETSCKTPDAAAYIKKARRRKR